MKVKHITAAEYVISSFGGVRAVSRAIRKHPSTISRWKTACNGRVPSLAQDEVIKAAKRKGIVIIESHLNARGKTIVIQGE